MKLEIGKPDYPYPTPFKKAWLRGWRAGKEVPLIMVTLKDIRNLYKTLPGIKGLPAYVSYDPVTKTVLLHPLPNGEYELELEPEVPVKEDAVGAGGRLSR